MKRVSSQATFPYDRLVHLQSLKIELNPLGDTMPWKRSCDTEKPSTSTTNGWWIQWKSQMILRRMSYSSVHSLALSAVGNAPAMTPVGRHG